jgi:NAD(P)-dependent dehydrogenase (short-subunit alcohol dehydrogenase family)
MEQGTNRVAIVTGASRGLGFVIASVLAARGTDIIIGGRQADALAHAADLLRRYGSAVIPVAGDITEARLRVRMVDAAIELGGLDVLIQNAAELGPIGPLVDFDVTRLGRVIPVNTGTPLALIQLAVPLLAKRRGLIVNIASDAAVDGDPEWGPYGASKAALELLTKTLATELRDTGVSALLVDPDDLRMRIHQGTFPGDDRPDRPLPDVTVSFWNWLFDQDPEDLRGQRLGAQWKDSRWLLPA